jgi:hypothetical protein
MNVNLDGKATGWPVGARLRFRLEAELKPKYRHLRGTSVKVFGPPHLVSPLEGRMNWEVRQTIWSDTFGAEGWANPHHLEPRPDDPNPPKMISVQTKHHPKDAIQRAVDRHPGLAKEAEAIAAAVAVAEH